MYCICDVINVVTLLIISDIPYGEVDVATTLESLVIHIESGNRLPQPEQCSNEMYG